MIFSIKFQLILFAFDFFFSFFFASNLDPVNRQLNTEYGAVLMDPPYHAHAFEGALAVIYNAGVKETQNHCGKSERKRKRMC